MNWWALFEIEAMLRSIDRSRRKPLALPPEELDCRPGLRRRLAEALVSLGLRLDAEASHAAAGSVDTTPGLNRSDA